MKKSSLILSFCLLTIASIAQERHGVFDEYGPVNYGVNALSSDIKLFLTADKQTKSIDPFNYIPHDPLGSLVFLDGATTATVTTYVRKDSLPYYRYTVIQDDSITLVADAPLKKVDFVWNKYSARPGYLTMNLGISNIANKKLTVKIYRYPKPHTVTTLIIYNKPLKPAQVLIKVLVKQGEFFKKTNRYLIDTIGIKKGAAFNVTDKTKGLWFSIKPTDLDFMYRVYLKYKNEDNAQPSYVTLPSGWDYRTYDGNPTYSITTDYFTKPGNYEIIITGKKIQDGDTSILSRQPAQISFTVLSPPIKYSARELLLVIMSVVMIAVLIILLIRRNNKKKLAAASRQNESTKNELNMVRAQLNPHFVFNALSGIQNLMNKNEVEMANNYLYKFARLTREVLDDKTMISIKDEMSLLEDYLAMEQLRFPFTYQINADNSTNFINTEIPAMLLQPFVENAVKHGMAQLKNGGEIVVGFTKDGKNLIITITDNGKGFNAAQNYEGLGLKLSKKRIALLNDVYKECPITLQIDSAPSNTTIRLILAHWL